MHGLLLMKVLHACNPDSLTLLKTLSGLASKFSWISCLNCNSNINELKIDGVTSSDCILWIGTPKLKSRISHTPDGKPSNPATFEFDLILSKVKEYPNSLIPLWFAGESIDAAYPPTDAQLQPLSFLNPRDYYRRLPILAATILGIANHSEFKRLYSDYTDNTNKLEKQFTHRAILLLMKQHHIEADKIHAKKLTDLMKLMNDIPDQYKKQQADTDEVMKKALDAHILAMRAGILWPSHHPLKISSILHPTSWWRPTKHSTQ
jgi:hypothetical protein